MCVCVVFYVYHGKNTTNVNSKWTLNSIDDKAFFKKWLEVIGCTKWFFVLTRCLIFPLNFYFVQTKKWVTSNGSHTFTRYTSLDCSIFGWFPDSIHYNTVYVKFKVIFNSFCHHPVELYIIVCVLNHPSLTFYR